MKDAAHRDPLGTANVEEGREDLVANKHVVLITKHRVRARQPAVAGQLIVIETKLTNQLRTLGTAAFQTSADVEYHQTVVPVSEISQTIFNLKIVNVTSGYLIAFFGFDRGGHLRLGLPARDLFRVLHVLEIDHAHRTRRIVCQVNVMTVDERTVNPTADSGRVFRDELRVRGIRRVVKRDPVLSIRRLLA